MIRTRVFPLVLALAGLTAASAGAAPSTKRSQPSAVSGDMAVQLQNYFADAARKQLGTLDVWQKKIFEEDALPEYQRFIRDYRFSKSKAEPAVEADIDFDALNDFMRFYAPKSLKGVANPSVVALLKTDAECPKCVAGIAGVKAILAKKLERRGLKVIWVSPSELGKDPTADIGELTEAVSGFATQKKASGTVIVNWEQVPADDEHPDDNQYEIRSNFAINGVLKTEGKLDLTDTGSFERSAAKLLTDELTEAGARLQKLELTQSELSRGEMTFEVTGIQSFTQYQAIKSQLQDALRSVASVEDGRISHGRAVFAVYSQLPPSGVQAQLGAGKLKLDGAELGPVTLQGSDFHLQILPKGGPQT